MANYTSSELNLLLIGKTGSGKSLTGNRILNWKAFEVGSQTLSETATTDLGVRLYNGTFIKVVDVPGVGDNRHTEQERKKFVQTRIKEAMLLSPEGYDAFLYVGKYGSRFTDEDVTVLKFLRETFGPDFVKNMCILILTCGDDFEADNEEGGKTFAEWCQNETGNFGTLMQDCGNRILLFNNRTKDNKVDKLLAQVRELKVNNNNRRYTDTNFEEARALRSKDLDNLERRLTKVSLLLQQLQEPMGDCTQDRFLNLSSYCAQILLSIQRGDDEFCREIRSELEDLKISLDYVSCRYPRNLIQINNEEEEDMMEILNDEILKIDLIYRKHHRKYVRNIVLLAVGFGLTSAVCVAGAVALAGGAGGAAALATGGAAALAGGAGGAATLATGGEVMLGVVTGWVRAVLSFFAR